MRFQYTAEHLDFLRQGYKDKSLTELAIAFNQHFDLDKPERSIRSALRNHRIRSGRTGHFEKGHSTWNAGTQWQAGGRSLKTQFKPGHKPQNWVPIGTEVVSKDGYLKRKIRDDAPVGMSRKNWKFVHIMVWEEHHGPVPKGYAVTFLDGDKRNFDPKNLHAIRRRELAWQNKHGIARLPDELRPTMQLLAKVEVKRALIEEAIEEAA